MFLFLILASLNCFSKFLPQSPGNRQLIVKLIHRFYIENIGENRRIPSLLAGNRKGKVECIAHHRQWAWN